MSEAEEVRDGQIELIKHLSSEITTQGALGPENPKTLKTMEHLGNVVDYAEAEALRSEILRIRQRVLGPDPRGVGLVLCFGAACAVTSASSSHV
jgi:hypothetical protein